MIYFTGHLIYTTVHVTYQYLTVCVRYLTACVTDYLMCGSLCVLLPFQGQMVVVQARHFLLYDILALHAQLLQVLGLPALHHLHVVVIQGREVPADVHLECPLRLLLRPQSFHHFSPET